MCIDAIRSIMLNGIRTPDSFILIHVEILIPGQKVDHFYFNLVLSVGECTELFVITFCIFVGVGLAEFCLVAAGVVDLLNFVVGKATMLILASSFGA